MGRARDNRTSHLWLAAGTGLLGVSLGAAAIVLGLRSEPEGRPSPVPPQAPTPTPTRVAAEPLVAPAPVAAVPREPTLVDAIARTRNAVVNLQANRTLGAGVIVHESGVVVTNYHVIKEALEMPRDGSRVAAAQGPSVVARFENGREIPATVLVADSVEDLALLRLSPPQPDESFAAVELGQSSSLRLGQDVFAIGNPLGLNHSVSRGIISALDRTEVIPDRKVPLIQLDATINVGNSGGPLFSRDGSLIGIVTMRKVGAEGIAFAVPVDHVRAFVDTVRDPDAPYRTGAIGVNVAADAEDTHAQEQGYKIGLRVLGLVPESTAAAAGVVENDLIVEVRGKRLDGVAIEPARLGAHLASTVRSLLPGERLQISVLRGAELMHFDVEIGQAPSDRQAMIDAEELLGMLLREGSDKPVVVATVPSTQMLGANPVGATLVQVLDVPIDSIETLGVALSDLREKVRAGGSLTVLLGVRRPGDPTTRPLYVLVE